MSLGLARDHIDAALVVEKVPDLTLLTLGVSQDLADELVDTGKGPGEGKKGEGKKGGKKGGGVKGNGKW